MRGGYGNGDNLQLSGVASGPLGSGGVLGRIVVGYKDAEGWHDNVATGVEADPYEDLTVAGKLLWDIGASTTLDLRLTYSNTESTGSQFVSNAPNFVTGFPGNAQYPGNGTAPRRAGPAGIDHGAGRRPEQHEHQAPGQRARHGRPRSRSTLSAKLDWESDFGTLTSITSFDTLDHVTAAEQFAYYPFVQVAGRPGAGRIRRASSCRHSRKR